MENKEQMENKENLPIIAPEKEHEVRKQYQESSMKETHSIKEYVHHQAKNNPSFIPWLFNFEQREDFDNAFTIRHRDVFDSWSSRFEHY